MSGHEISVDEVHAQLRRVLLSPEFADSEDARELLRFCVEKTVCGEQDVLHDSLPLLLSQTADLRARLRRYYEKGGLNDALVIDLPAGDFVPKFRQKVAQAEPAHGTSPPKVIYWAAAGAIAAFAIAGATLWSRISKTSSQGPILHRVTTNLGLDSYPALSPDGRLLAYASDRSGDGNLDLWIQSMDNGTPLRLTSDKADEREPSFSPDGRFVVYRSERDGGGIYRVPSSGGQEVLLIQGGRGPRFSPDGKWILYWVEGENFNPGSAWVIPSEGGNPRRLLPSFQDSHTPVWSSDGKHVLVCGTKNSDIPEEGHDLWVMRFPQGEPVKTGAFRILNVDRTAAVLPNALDSSQWSGDSVIYTARIGDSTNVYRIQLNSGTWQAVGPPQRLTFGSGLELHPAIAGKLLVFTSGNAHSSVFGLPVDAETGNVTGELRRYTENTAAWEFYPSTPDDGSFFVFLSNRLRIYQVYRMNLEDRREMPLTDGPVSKSRPRVSRDGKEVAYRVIEQGKRWQAIYAVPANGGAARRICADCGIPTSWSADRKWLLFETGRRRTTIGVLATNLGPDHRYESRPQSEFLVHPRFAVHAAKFSPDDHWIVFHADNEPGHKQIFLAPFRGEQPSDPSEWQAVTDGTSADEHPVFSPKGSVVYFLSQRDGFRCVWARRIERNTMQPKGNIFPVQHFHSASRSFFVTTGERPDAAGLAVSNGMLIFSLDEVSSNIWSTELPN